MLTKKEASTLSTLAARIDEEATAKTPELIVRVKQAIENACNHLKITPAVLAAVIENKSDPVYEHIKRTTINNLVKGQQ